MDDAGRARTPAFSVACFAAALLAALAPADAWAQFFHLDGLLKCIDHPETPACRERSRLDPEVPVTGAVAPPPTVADTAPKQPAPVSGRPGPPPDAASAGAKPAATEKPRRAAPQPPPRPASRASPASSSSPTGAPSASTAVRRPGGNAAALKRAIAHVQAGRATRDDMTLLEAKAAADDPAAVEVLAWCYLYGREISADRIAAYRLYGRAAALGVPHARDNQRIIFERLLTNGERQKVLEAENAAGAAPRTGTELSTRQPNGSDAHESGRP
jgi:hypothetical protein